MTAFPPELRGYRVLVVASSLFLAGAEVVALILLLSPETTQGPRVFLASFAVMAFAVSGFGLVFVPRWYRRAAYIVSAITPLPAEVTLTLDSDSESTSLYAAISTSCASIQFPDRIAVLMPRWDVRPSFDASLQGGLYIDPRNFRLMAITIKAGILWCMPTGHVARTQSAA